MPYHFPGYRYCGPGTDIHKSDKEGGPVNALDAICRLHDYELSKESNISQKEADNHFITNAPKTGWLGNFFASLLVAKEHIRESVPYIESYLPGNKEQTVKTSSTKGFSLLSKSHRRKRPNSEINEQPGENEGNNRIKQQRTENQESTSNWEDTEFFLAPSESIMSSSNNELPETEQEGGTGGRHVRHNGIHISGMDSNPVPLSTGKVILHFSRVLRHYITMPEMDFITKQGWSDIPYQYICASLKPADWQSINCLSKRWRVLSAGFNMEKIVPLENTITSTGGTVTPKVALQVMPYLETYIDKGYQLPTMKLYDSNSPLPNQWLFQNNGDQTTAALKHVTFDFAQTKSKYSNPSRLKWVETMKIHMDLMNSKEWGTCTPNQVLSFEWKPNAEDLCWRHALHPADMSPLDKNFDHPASPLGRWDGDHNHDKNNMDWNNRLTKNMTKPMPAALVRPMTIHDASGNIINIAFTCLTKYHSTIELDLNDFRNLPIWLADFSSGNVGVEQAMDLYNDTDNKIQPKASAQWTGAASNDMRSGPRKGGHLI